MAKKKTAAAGTPSNPRTDTVEVKTPLGVLVCRLPGTPEWDLYLQKLKRGQQAVGRRELVQLCAISPDLEAIKAMLQRYPGLPEPVVDELGRLVGDETIPDEDHDGGTITVTVDGSEYSFAAPSQLDWEEVDAQRKNPKVETGPAFRSFLSKCHQGEQGALDVLFKRWPGIIATLVRSLGNIAGSGFEVVVKKGVSSSGGQSGATSPQPSA